ncbi:MAG: hypothetical protein ACRDGB_08110 [Candidatus Limnocylindria bacterium]
MNRTIATVALIATLALAACSGPAAQPELEDPKEILTRSVEAMAEIESVHFVFALDGTVNVAEMGGGSMALDGTELEGRLAMDGSAAEMSFAVPAFLGLAGEMRLIGDEAFVKTTMTGPMWMRQAVEEGADDPFAQAGDPQEALNELRSFLDTDGVVIEKLADVECGEATCYQLEIAISGEVFADSPEAAAAGAEVLEALGEGLTFNVRFQKDTLYLAGASTSFEDEETGSLTFTMTFDEYGEPVDVEPPPADEVTDAEGFTLP